MTPRLRLWLLAGGGAGLAAFFLWGLLDLPAFGHYRGPYGTIIARVTVAQTHATGVVSAVNFFYRGFDTVGEEFILFTAAIGMATVLRMLASDGDGDGDGAAAPGARRMQTSETVRMTALVFTGPVLVLGWFLTTHAQTDPSGGFQGGIVMASAVIMIYLGGQFLVFRRISPPDFVDALEALGAGAFVLVGVGTLASGAAFLADVLPLGSPPGAVDASGTIALISFFVGVEVTAAFALIVNELLQQNFLVRADRP